MAWNLEAAVVSRLAAFERERLIERIGAKDHTVWKPDPTEIVDRLGWLEVAGEMRSQVASLESFAREAAADGFRYALLLGMGGSSLGPEVLRDTFGVAPGMLELLVLDSTHPQQIRETVERLDLEQTLVIVSSKSGTTIETTCQLDYFWGLIGRGRQFVAITDPGSSLAALGRERGFRRVFENRPDIGGRYSVLSHFGMVPAALIGAPIAAILAEADAMAARCSAAGSDNPGVALGAAMGEAALAGRDKLTLVLPAALESLGVWIEQLVAESTGKEGRGILPVEREPLDEPAAYGHDRFFVAYEASPGLERIELAGHPVFQLENSGLGGEFFRWEFATAVAGAILGVQPFDQPNVQEAKDAAGIVLAGKEPEVDPLPLASLLARIQPGDYIAISAFISRNPSHEARLAKVREALRDRTGAAVTVGFGPRFLHSTGQLHKGGPGTGAFIEIVDAGGADIAIPGRPYSFQRLLDAQALGDLAALLGRGRRAARVTLEELEGFTRRWPGRAPTPGTTPRTAAPRHHLPAPSAAPSADETTYPPATE